MSLMSDASAKICNKFTHSHQPKVKIAPKIQAEIELALRQYRIRQMFDNTIYMNNYYEKSPFGHGTMGQNRGCQTDPRSISL